MTSQRTAIGIDIGGTGIKGGLVDLGTGELVSERHKVATPTGGEPEDIVEAVGGIVARLAHDAPGASVGVCFPAIIKSGRTLSAANVSPRWIGLEAEALFERTLERPIDFVNDADAAGYAEGRVGAARGEPGTVLVTTLGTGIGSALLHEGVLVPNFELGHLEIDGRDAESHASNAAREREGLDWAAWAERLQRYYTTLEALFSPDLFVVGGGVSKSSERFLPLLELSTRIVPARHRNNAGIIGAAAFAAH